MPRYVRTENIPLTSLGSVFCSAEKGKPAELGRVGAASDILGFFIIKKLLSITLFRLHKRPNIFNVLTITSA